MSSLKRILRRNEIAFGYRLGYLFNHFAVPVYKWTAAELGIQRPEFATMFCIAHLAEPTASDVVELTGIPKNSVSRAVNRLLSMGLVRRAADRADGRRAMLSLTPKGERLYVSILPRFQARQDAMLSVLSTAERKQLNTLLNKLVERDDDWAAPR